MSPINLHKLTISNVRGHICYILFTFDIAIHRPETKSSCVLDKKNYRIYESIGYLVYNINFYSRIS